MLVLAGRAAAHLDNLHTVYRRVYTVVQLVVQRSRVRGGRRRLSKEGLARCDRYQLLMAAPLARGGVGALVAVAAAPPPSLPV